MGFTEMLVIAAAALLIFGPKRLPELAKGLGKGIRDFKKALEGGLETQLGCLVGESSVLAYAGLHFAALADQLRYHEGCFGKLLIKWDVVNPSLTFSRGGRVSLSQLPKAGLMPMFNVDRLRQQAFQSEVLEGRL